MTTSRTNISRENPENSEHYQILGPARSRMFLLIENYPESKTREIYYQQKHEAKPRKKLSGINSAAWEIRERKDLREGKDQGGESSTDDESKRSQRSVKPRRTPPRSPVRTRGQMENKSTPEQKEKATPHETGAVKKAPRDEQQLWRYCKEVLRQMTEATDRQKNISMDVKKGLARLQEAMDRLQRIRRKNPELQSRSAQTEWVVQKLRQKTQATQVTPGKVAAAVAKPGNINAKPQAAQVGLEPPKRATRPPVKKTKAEETQKEVMGDTNTEEKAKGGELGWTKTQSRRARRKARKGEKTA
ncbi:hypothetical protein NQ317_016234, partial [Molorchus minor]